MFLSSVPALQKGVRHPPITATRRALFTRRAHEGAEAALVAYGLTEASFATERNDAGDRRRARIHRLDNLPGKQNLKWLDQRDEFTPLQQMVIRAWSPSELALILEKGFVQEVTTGSNRLFEMFHPLPVEVVESHHDVEGRFGKGQGLEIRALPHDRKPLVRGDRPTGFHRFLIGIDRHDVRPQLGGGNRVSPFPATDVEHLVTGLDEPGMPTEPGAGTSGRTLI